MSYDPSAPPAEMARERIQSYRDYRRRYCLSDRAMRRRLSQNSPGIRFQRARFRVGAFVRSRLYSGTFLVVGHGFTGRGGEERGCYGCLVGRTTIHRKWQWVGPDKNLRAA